MSVWPSMGGLHRVVNGYILKVGGLWRAEIGNRDAVEQQAGVTLLYCLIKATHPLPCLFSHLSALASSL